MSRFGINGKMYYPLPLSPSFLPSFPTHSNNIQALAQMSLLGNIPLSLTELHTLSNDILSLAGDKSVDSSWYTRRAAVGAIYASAEVVMTKDPTADMKETEEFVSRRFEDRDILAKKVEVIGQCVSFWGNTVVGVGRSYGLKI